MCGDSTDLSDLEHLMAGKLADMVFTDPPFNVDYTGKTEEALKIENDHTSDTDFKRFRLKVYGNLFSISQEGAAIYVCHADSEGINFRSAMVEAGWLLKQCIIWVKQSFVMGRQDYHWRHEPILYGWKPGAAHRRYADRKQDTVWEFDRPSRKAEHPTMKPIELVANAVRNSSQRGTVLPLSAQAGIPYATDTSVTANTVTASITPAPTAYTDRYSVQVKVANTTTVATTLNINGSGAVAVNKSDGTPVGSGDLVAGVPAIFTYAAGTTPAFIASCSGGGLSGTGNATAADARAPKTFTSSTGKAQTGTLVHRGNGPTVTPGTSAQTFAAGIYNSLMTVQDDANLTAANIPVGKSMFGIAGTYTSDATATAARMLAGAIAYVNGQKITGTMPNNGALNFTPSGTQAFTIPAGYTPGGTVAQVNVPAANGDCFGAHND